MLLQRRTNAEIARALLMSKRTIELHLTRVFRKFGVARKSQLIELDSVRTGSTGRPSADRLFVLSSSMASSSTVDTGQ